MTSTEDGNNLHRNVLYRDGADLARQMLPYTVEDSFNPEALWTWMQGYQDKLLVMKDFCLQLLL